MPPAGSTSQPAAMACCWLSEECWGRGLIRLAELLDDLLTERQAEQPEPQLDPELEALLPF